AVLEAVEQAGQLEARGRDAVAEPGGGDAHAGRGDAGGRGTERERAGDGSQHVGRDRPDEERSERAGMTRPMEETAGPNRRSYQRGRTRSSGSSNSAR